MFFFQAGISFEILMVGSVPQEAAIPPLENGLLCLETGCLLYMFSLKTAIPSEVTICRNEPLARG